MEKNCLTRALDQWSQNSDFRLWYNSNHVISLEQEYSAYDLSEKTEYNVLNYAPLSYYGYVYFKAAFSLNKKYLRLLQKYLKCETL